MSNEKQKPLGVFFSYAREDNDIVSAFYQSFQDLNKFVHSNIYVFKDSYSINPGDNIPDLINKNLLSSNYLIVFYTETLKKSHSWTGVELGFYQGLVAAEKAMKRRPERKIIPIYIKNKPETVDSLGISIHIQPKNLNIPTADFEAIIRADADLERSPLAVLLKEVAAKAAERLSSSVPGDREQELVDRTKEIEDKIVPGIWLAMHGCLGGRVARRSIEQRLIEFEIDVDDMRGRGPGIIPPTTKMTDHNDAFHIFNMYNHSGETTWEELKHQLTNSAKSQSHSMLRAIERVFESAVTDSPIDNEQIIMSPSDGRIFRVIVTRHFDYFNGKKLLHMYFIEILRMYDFGDTNTSLLLSFINVTARYRFIFLEASSELSLQAFVLERAFTAFQDKIRRVVRELTLIEDDSKRLRLDTPDAVLVLYGEHPDLIKLSTTSDEWFSVRDKLFSVAQTAIGNDIGEDKFVKIRSEWLEVLGRFVESTRRMNAEIGTRALQNMADFFVDTPVVSSVLPTTNKNEQARSAFSNDSHLDRNEDGKAPQIP